MKNTWMIVVLLSCNMLEAADFSQRPLKIRSTYESLPGAETIKFAYDKIGNINSVTTFSAGGDITESEYYFHEQGCARKILKYRGGHLFSRSILIKDSQCRTLQIIDYSDLGKMISIRKNVYSNNLLASYVEYDHLNQISSEGKYVYEDEHLIRMEFSDKSGQHTLTYKYTPGYIFFFVIHEIIGHDGTKVTGKMVFTIEQGPITKEAMRAFFE